MNRWKLLFTALPKIIKARKGCVPGKPCIGVAVSDSWPDRFQFRRLPYDLALARAQATVRTFIPDHIHELDSMLNDIDGLVIAGGEDIHPKHYSGDIEYLRSVNERRDHLELTLLDKAFERNLPVLCICRGAQLLAVWAGGKLESHDENSRLMKLHFSTVRSLARHRVIVKPGSRLQGIIGDAPMTVNSFHHQNITDSGKLIVTASTKQGLIEGIEMEGERFVIGVQWHPELQAFYRPRQQALFKALVAEAQKRKRI